MSCNEVCNMIDAILYFLYRYKKDNASLTFGDKEQSTFKSRTRPSIILFGFSYVWKR